MAEQISSACKTNIRKAYKRAAAVNYGIVPTGWFTRTAEHFGVSRTTVQNVVKDPRQTFPDYWQHKATRQPTTYIDRPIGFAPGVDEAKFREMMEGVDYGVHDIAVVERLTPHWIQGDANHYRKGEAEGGVYGRGAHKVGARV